MGFRQGTEKDYELGRWHHYTCRGCGATIERYLSEPLPKEYRFCAKCMAKREQQSSTSI